MILGGTFLPVDQLPWYLEYPAHVIPVTSIVEAMQYIVNGTGTAEAFQTSLLALAILGGATITVAGRTVRRLV